MSRDSKDEGGKKSLKEILTEAEREETPQEGEEQRTAAKQNNIFNRQRGSNNKSSGGGNITRAKSQNATPIVKDQALNDKMEREFERRCQLVLKNSQNLDEDWDNLENLAKDFIQKTASADFRSFKGFFYYGIALYKQAEYENAIKALKEAESLNEEDAQLHYNLGLAYFKLELYNPAVEHWRRCIRLDPAGFPHAYSNLAFLFNLHQFYQETIIICGQAKLHCGETVAYGTCYRHWAFALFKKGEMAKAVKKIKKSIEKARNGKKDPDNWIIWGLILRYNGNYKSARHKFLKALKVDTNSDTARQELAIIDRIIQLDAEIPMDAIPSLSILSKMRNG